ncbi:hypothetical protein AB1K62_10230 [Parasphingorhabdus sp. JC815]|uniref:hypothetical protein n=1 Tax=Parasphingorhabdus sp. JC815 TaxID=3232140 RepID=UPI00345A9AF9
MADDKKQPEVEGSESKKTDTKGGDSKNDKWTTGAKVGAAVGSAAIAAALIYAGRHKMRKLDEFKTPKPKAGIRYENEPVDDAIEEEEE